jgi:hypothetical protein
MFIRFSHTPDVVFPHHSLKLDRHNTPSKTRGDIAAYRSGFRVAEGHSWDGARNHSPLFRAAAAANFRMDDDSIPLKLPLAAPLPTDW